jgi:hypothetical protein
MFLQGLPFGALGQRNDRIAASVGTSASVLAPQVGRNFVHAQPTFRAECITISKEMMEILHCSDLISYLFKLFKRTICYMFKVVNVKNLISLLFKLFKRTICYRYTVVNVKSS